MFNPIPQTSSDSLFVHSTDAKSNEKHINFQESTPPKPKKISFLDKPPIISVPRVFQKRHINHMFAKRTAKSTLLVGNETIEKYFMRIENEKIEKKNLIKAEIKEQTLSLTQIFPQMHLTPELKVKWIRVRNKLRIHVSMVKSHQDVKLFGLNYNKNGHIKKLENEGLNPSIEKKKLKKTLFHPGSKFKSIWSFILYILLMYTAYMTPLEIAFVDTFPPELNALEYIVNILFILDMLVSLNSSYFDSNNQLVQTRRKIINNYLRGWFIIDLMAAFPFELVENEFLTPDNSDNSMSFSTVNSSDFKQLLKLPRIYRLFRLARLIKMVTKTKNSKYLMKLQETFNLNSGFISMINYIIIISVAINFMGCVWFFEAEIRGFEPGTWIYELQLQDEGAYDLYTYSVYWAIQTLSTVGYGDVHAFNMIERLICIIWMSVGAGFYSYSIGSLSSVITNLDTRKAKLRKKRIIMDEFCKENRMSKPLHLKIRRALEYTCIKSLFTIDEKIEFLRELPTDLKYEISKYTRESILINYPFFKNKDKLFIAEFVLFLSPLKLRTGEMIYEKGQHPNSVFFIIKGKVGLVEGPDKMVYKSFVPGGYFGEIEIFSECVRISNAQALMECEFLTINRTEFLMILNNFPEITLELRKISVEKQKRIFENLKNIKHLLPLAKKSTFWLKRRKTIRSVNQLLTKKFLEPYTFLQKNQSLSPGFFQIIRRLIPSFSFFTRKNKASKTVSSAPSKMTKPQIVKDFCENTDATYKKNKTIMEYLELKSKYEQKNDIKLFNNKLNDVEQFATHKPKFFRFSNDMMLNLKGILKFQNKNLQENKGEKSLSKDPPWHYDLKARSQSLSIHPVGFFKTNYKKTKNKSASLQNFKIFFQEQFVKSEGEEKKIDEPDTMRSFLLLDNKPDTTIKERIKRSEEKWMILERNSEEIIEKLDEANNKLLALKKKLELKKQKEKTIV